MRRQRKNNREMTDEIKEGYYLLVYFMHVLCFAFYDMIIIKK